MKGSKELVLEYLEQELLKNNNRGLNTKEIATALGMQRPNVSTILNRLVKDGVLLKGTTQPIDRDRKSVV